MSANQDPAPHSLLQELFNLIYCRQVLACNFMRMVMVSKHPPSLETNAGYQCLLYVSECGFDHLFSIGLATFQGVVAKHGARVPEVGAAVAIYVWVLGAILKQDGGSKCDFWSPAFLARWMQTHK